MNDIILTALAAVFIIAAAVITVVGVGVAIAANGEG